METVLDWARGRDVELILEVLNCLGLSRGELTQLQQLWRSWRGGRGDGEDFVQWLWEPLESRAPELCGVRLGEFQRVAALPWLAKECGPGRQRPNMYHLVEDFIKPCTHGGRLAYAELLPELPPEIFVSHWWGEEFLSFVATLTNFAKTTNAEAFWVCSFANRQLKVNLGNSLLASPFERALASPSCGTVLMVMDEAATPLRRIWCLYEVLRTHALKKDFHMGTENGILTHSTDECHGSLRADLLQLTRQVLQIDASTASASRETDRLMILEEVDKVVGVEQFNLHVKRLLKDTFVKRGGNQLAADDPFLKPQLALLDVRVKALVTFEGRCELHVAAQRELAAVAPQQLAQLAARNGLGQQPLHMAACFGRSSNVLKLCEAMAMVDAADDNGLTPLMLAAFGGREANARLLLERGADLQQRPAWQSSDLRQHLHSTLIMAAFSGSLDCMELLLDRGAHVEQEALLVLCMAGHLEPLRCLLRHLSLKELNGRVAQITPLFVACAAGQKGCVEALLEARCEVDALCLDRKTALFGAMGAGHLHLGQLLVEARADPLRVCESGDTALTLAAGGGFNDCVEYLLAQGADLYHKDFPAIFVAAEYGRDSTVELLARHSAEVSVQVEGSTALHKAAEYNYVSTLQVLLGLRADLSQRDSSDRTALMVAREERSADAAEFLAQVTGLEL